MAAQAVADRVAAIRKYQAATGRPTDHLSDTEILLREIDDITTEKRKVENARDNLLQDRVEHDRAVRAAARRETQDDRRAWGGLYLQAILRDAMHPINELVYRAGELADRPTAKQVAELKTAAKQAKWRLSGVTSTQGLAEQRDEQVTIADKWRAEIWRLREVITAQGEQLHAQRGATAGRRCDCAGCELIRAMDAPSSSPLDGRKNEVA